MLRKRLTILAVAAMLLASVGVFSAPALADVHPNAHNCAGFISTIAPEDVNHNQQGTNISAFATENPGELGAIQGEQASQELGNCGATGSQAHQ